MKTPLEWLRLTGSARIPPCSVRILQPEGGRFEVEYVCHGRRFVYPVAGGRTHAEQKAIHLLNNGRG